MYTHGERLCCVAVWADMQRLGVQRAARAAKKETKVIYKEEYLRTQQRMAVPAPSVIPMP